MANVAERLKVLYGESAKMVIDTSDSGGTVVRLSLPILQHYEPGLSVSTAYSDARSSTSR
jgi:LytS/YehU family sensor histidine kinase